MFQVYKHENSSLHEMGIDHYEAPVRIKIIQEALEESKLKFTYKEAREAKENEIMQIHSSALISIMRRSTGLPQFSITPDTKTNMFTYQAALTSAGGAIQVAENLKKSDGFSMLRPPGHHATIGMAMGFCFFNNIALAATNLLSNNYRKIAIIDIDQHHGNGTQDIFERNPNVLYTSLHADPEISFPGTGYCDEVGIGEGIGKSVNVPLPQETNDEEYLYCFDEIIVPIIAQYKPEAILVSLGYDGLKGDPYGSLNLTPDIFYHLGSRIRILNKQYTKSSVGCILEGGYRYDQLGIANVNFFSGLENENSSCKIIEPKFSNKLEITLRRVKSIQRNHWFGI